MELQQQPLTVSPSRLSRDEMNLAEFPLTVLSTRASTTIKTLEFRDTIHAKNGEIIAREWIITAADKFGLPTSSDDEILLGLLKLTVDKGFQSRKVYFTRYELLKALRWTTEGRNYTRLQRALDRLSGVRIKATNAFFDNASKSHSTANFGIIDAYELNDGRDGSSSTNTPSFFIWSEVLYDSFQVGYIKKLDLDFYLALTSAVSKRLYRFLDKHFWYKATLRMNVFVLAHEKLGVSRNYRYVSSIKQQLDPAMDELVKAGFLKSYSYEGRGEATELIIVSARTRGRAFDRRDENSALSSSTEMNIVPAAMSSEATPSPMQQLPLSDEFDQIKAEISASLLKRGIRQAQVEQLLANSSIPLLQRIKKIIAHFDKLIASKSRLVSKNPAGFLYYAVKSPDQFRLPNELPHTTSAQSVTSAHLAEAKSASFSDEENLKSQYLTERKLEIRSLQRSVEKELLQSIKKEVTNALAKIRGLVKEDHFAEAVELGVEEKLARLFALPTFEEWLKNRGKAA